MPIAKKVAEKVVKKAAERVKKVSSKKTVVKPKKGKEPKSSIVYQFADKEYDLNSLTNIAKDVWTYDLEGKEEELNSVKLYMKPEEGKVYYIFNDNIEGAFYI